MWLLVLLPPGLVLAQPSSGPTSRGRKMPMPPGFVEKQLPPATGIDRKYVVFLPARYDEDQSHRWPVILFLHGSGECGVDGRRHLRVGLPRYIARRPRRFPFITVMPQAKTLWYRGEDAAAALASLGAVLQEYRTDPDRVYLTGLSMGGFATWEFAVTRPDTFAAIVPVCGVAPMGYISNIARLPVWAFHGAKDKRVPVSGSRDPIEALKQLGASPKYTEYPDQGHLCWDKAYATPELWRWLLLQRRSPAPRSIDYRLAGGSARVWWLGVAAEPDRKAPAEIHARVNDTGKVTVTSEGVPHWALLSEAPPLQPGQHVEILWNGETVFSGKFVNGLSFGAKPRAP